MSFPPLNPYQKHAVELMKRHNEFVLICGRGWGKTHTAIAILMYYLTQFKDPNWTVWWISKTMKQAKAIAWERIQRYFKHVFSHVNRQEAVMVTKNGVRLEFVGTELDPDSLRGRNVILAVWDEPFICHYSFLEDILRPSLRHPEGKSRLVLIGTVPDVNEDIDPLWFEYIDKMKKEGKVYIGASTENEGYGLPKGFVAQKLKEAEAMGLKDIAEREYLCKFSRAFESYLHYLPRTLVDEIPSSYFVDYRICSIDPHPSKPNAMVVAEYVWHRRLRKYVCFIIWAGYIEQPIDNLIKKAQEIERERGLFTHRVIDMRMARQKNQLFGIGSLADWLSMRGFYTIGGNPDQDLFMQKLYTNLVNGTLRIYRKNAIRLYEQLKRYRVEKVRGKYKKRTQKDDDLVDCLRYILNMGIDEFEKGLPIDGWRTEVFDYDPFGELT